MLNSSHFVMLMAVMVQVQLATPLLPLVYTDTLQWNSDGRKVGLDT